MDFFANQDEARRNSRFLVVLFALGVAALIGLTNLLVWAVMNNDTMVQMAGYRYDLTTFLTVTISVVLVVAIASIIRTRMLARGGEAVAEMMGAERIQVATRDRHERRLLNVVEEMAIASGTPVPPVYLLPGDAINAFAAGYSSSDAVVAVTRGALQRLSRDELQGVVAHEFSHILNGDMRLNIRLMGLLFGILVLAISGRVLLQSARGSRNGAWILGMGVGLMLIGYTGKFVAEIIKAGVSRQREFLADASAVQFTRNPTGIAGALKKIGGVGSEVENPDAEEVSHMFFASGVSGFMSRVLSTHPPLAERIRRIEPDWQGDFPAAPRVAVSEDEVISRLSDEPAHVAELVGETAEEETVGNLIASIPLILQDAAHEPAMARAVVYLLMLDDDPAAREAQLDRIDEIADFRVAEELVRLVAAVPALDIRWRLPLLEIAMPALRQLSDAQRERFLANVDTLARMDNRLQLGEWLIQSYLARHLSLTPQRRSGRAQVDKMQGEIGLVLTLLASLSGDGAEAAFVAGAEVAELEDRRLRPLSLAHLNDAVRRLERLHPLQKPKFLKACVATIKADHRVTPQEYEVTRVVADLVDCPLPPLKVAS